VGLSGSSLPIARHCRWAFREDVKFSTFKRSDDSDAAEGGTTRHDAYSEYVDNGILPPLSPGDALIVGEMVRFWNGEERRSGWRSEVSFALDPVAPSARELGTRLGRQYPELPPGTIPLTVDYVGLDSHGMLVVGDWKGWDPAIEDPGENLQLLAGGAAAALALGHERVKLEVVSVTENGAWVRSALIGPLELFQAVGEISRIVGSVAGSEATAGDHCRWCPALGGCPATGPMLERVARPVQAVVWTKEFISVDNDAAMILELVAVKNAVKTIEEALKERAGSVGTPLPNGKVYRGVLSRRTGLDTKKVEEFLGPRLSEFQKTTEFETYRQVKP